ncbi:hypothetical protein J6590_057471 [Homalodisca vitripennis]|nr:hypothetical protein J6590_057471 [Homalodisca vitripennis]
MNCHVPKEESSDSIRGQGYRAMTEEEWSGCAVCSPEIKEEEFPLIRKVLIDMF